MTEVSGKFLKDHYEEAFVQGRLSVTLGGPDIASQYFDLPHTIKDQSLYFMLSGLILEEGVDYSVSLTGGVGGVSRVSFLNDFSSSGSTPLVSGSKVYFKYDY